MLSGGAGTRLRPITHTSAKQLVPVANKPCSSTAWRHRRDAGITEVGIVVGDTAAEIEAAVGDGSAFGLQVTYIRRRRPLGLAHAVLIARDFLGDDDFVMYLGDNFIVGGITDLVDSSAPSGPPPRSCSPRCADPRRSASPSSTPTAGDRPGGEAGTPRATSRWSASTCSRPAIHEAVRRSSRPGAASWRSPTPSSG